MEEGGLRCIDTCTHTHIVPEENVATPQRDACTIEGQVKDVLLNGDTENYSGEQGYTTHTIARDHSKGIMVQLNHPYIVNCIRMLLWDRDNRSYSYFVQVSHVLPSSHPLHHGLQSEETLSSLYMSDKSRDRSLGRSRTSSLSMHPIMSPGVQKVEMFYTSLVLERR